MPSRPADAHSSSSRARLLRSAKRLFAQHGYEQTATSAIARQAGTSESQLMRYFGGKVGLLDALFDELWRELNQRVHRAAAGAELARDKILAVLQTLHAALTRDPALATLLLFEGRRIRGDEPRVRLSDGFLQFAGLTRSIVRRGHQTRELDPSLDAAAVTSALIGAAEGMVRDRLLTRAARARPFPEREVLRTVDAMIDGFSQRPARSPQLPGRRRARKTGPRIRAAIR